MAARTPRFQSWPAVSAGHTSCWTTVHSVLPHKGTDRQVSDNTCKDKTIYSQRVVETETYMGDGEWATGGESQLPSAHLLHDRHMLPNPRAANIRQQGEPRRHPEPWQYTPTSGTPLGVPRGLTMTLMELVNESVVQNVASWNPASLLRTIPLPVYQVLITSAPTPNVNEPLHGIGCRPLDESGRRRGRD